MKLQKKVSKKVRAIVQSDMLVAVAITSLCINVFFLAGLVLFASSNRLDEGVYNVAVDNLCNKHYEQNMNRRAELKDDAKTAMLKFDIICNKGEFSKYYENAVEAYLNDKL